MQVVQEVGCDSKTVIRWMPMTNEHLKLFSMNTFSYISGLYLYTCYELFINTNFTNNFRIAPHFLDDLQILHECASIYHRRSFPVKVRKINLRIQNNSVTYQTCVSGLAHLHIHVNFASRQLLSRVYAQRTMPLSKSI